MIGNTMNSGPNGTSTPCTILTQSSALLNLNANANIQAAFLYWSGSGTLAEADLNVKLNGAPITAQKHLLLQVQPVWTFLEHLQMLLLL